VISNSPEYMSTNPNNPEVYTQMPDVGPLLLSREKKKTPTAVVCSRG
jgi:hypothetical protein